MARRSPASYFGDIMANAIRFYRTECNINYFGNVMLELKDSGLRIVSRDRPGEVHIFPWEYLRKVCKCETCASESQIEGRWV